MVLRRPVELAAFIQGLSQIVDGKPCSENKDVRVRPHKTEARRTWCPSRFTGVRRGASDAGESPWRQLRERAEEIPGDKKHDPGLRGFSHGVIALRCSIQDRTIEYSTEWIAVFVSSDSRSVIKLPAAASRLGHPPHPLLFVK